VVRSEFIEHIEWDTVTRGAEGRLLRRFEDPGGLKRRALERLTLS
jgi:hypothetical protein